MVPSVKLGSNIMNLCPLDSIPVCYAMFPFIFIFVPFNSWLHANNTRSILFNDSGYRPFFSFPMNASDSVFIFDREVVNIFSFSYPLFTNYYSFPAKENFYFTLKFSRSCSKYFFILDWLAPYFEKYSIGFSIPTKMRNLSDTSLK